MKLLGVRTRSGAIAVLLLFAPRVQTASSNLQEPAKPPAQASSNSFALPNDTLVFAKLAARLDTKHSKPGDRVEAQITEDVKSDQQAVLKRGSQIIGQTVELKAPLPNGGVYGVAIVFDTVQEKNGGNISLHLIVRAIAPPPDQGTNAITDLPPGFDGHANGNQGAVEELTAKSEGPIHFSDMGIAAAVAKGTAISILFSKNQPIRLERGTQIVFRVLNPQPPAPPK